MPFVNEPFYSHQTSLLQLLLNIISVAFASAATVLLNQLYIAISASRSLAGDAREEPPANSLAKALHKKSTKTVTDAGTCQSKTKLVTHRGQLVWSVTKQSHPVWRLSGFVRES